jgi:2-amino-4-hydroxy-6-hydroxymethyldihydropteridine diphosphokinase
MNKVFLSIGTNLGDRAANIETAYQLIEKYMGQITLQSSWYETAPWGVLDQPHFINTCIAIKTDLSPIVLLNKITLIEKEIGRVRYLKWGERLIDIDILFYNEEVIENESLDIPHPYIEQRIFVLKPLAEIAPDYMHPVSKSSIKDLSLNCKDETTYSIINAKWI